MLDRPKPNKIPTQAQRRRWENLIEIGCIVGPIGCAGRMTIHHCFTGGGGRKNHDQTIALCHEHHQGTDGIDGKRISKREWQLIHGSEADLLAKTNAILG